MALDTDPAAELETSVATQQTTDPSAQVENTIPQPVARPPPAPAPVPAMPMRMPRPGQQYTQGGLTFTMPGAQRAAPTGSDSPAYQAQLEREQLDIYRHAKNTEQALKDVQNARKMLGILSADRAMQAGATPEQAIFKNLHLLTTPGSAASRMAQPIPKPYGTTIAAGTNQIPAIVTPGPGGAQHTQIVPRSAMPQPAFTPSVRELEPGLRAAQLGPNRYQLLKEGGPEKLSDVDKIRYTSLNRELDQVLKLKNTEAARPSGLFAGGPRKDVVKELNDREKDIRTELKQFESGQKEAKRKLKWSVAKQDFE